jgi:hypothetical protein
MLSLIALGWFGLASHIERRASVCGAGFEDPGLPFGVHPDWFNGLFHLNDDEGLRIVSPPELKTTDGRVISFDRVAAYSVERGFFVELESATGQSTFIALSPAVDRRRVERRVVSRGDVAEVQWVSVRPDNCLFGHVWGARFLALVGGVLAGVSALRFRSNGRERL